MVIICICIGFGVLFLLAWVFRDSSVTPKKVALYALHQRDWQQMLPGHSLARGCTILVDWESEQDGPASWFWNPEDGALIPNEIKEAIKDLRVITGLPKFGDRFPKSVYF